MTGVFALELKLLLQIYLTLAVLSFLYRDNPIYRFAEHIFVGVAAGYYVVVEFHTVFMPNLIRPLRDRGIVPLFSSGHTVNPVELLLLLPGALGMMVFLKFFDKTSWLVRWPMAVVIGVFSGQAILGSAQGDLIPQIQANVLPILKPGAWSRFVAGPAHTAGSLGLGGFLEDRFFSLLDLLYNPILIAGVACCLVYFFFSKEHKGVTGGAATIGIWFLMISFGASYGNTVMTRVSLFLERANFLLRESTPMPGGGEIQNLGFTAVVLALVLAFLVIYRLKAGPERF